MSTPNNPPKSWLQARQTKFGLYAIVYTLIVIGIVGGVNFLANRYNKSLDSTSTKKFTLSEQTTKIAKNLKTDVTITYWDKASNFPGAHDLLDRYKTLSPKIDVQYQDVDKKKTAALAAGVKSYGTVFVKVGEKQQAAKSLTEEEVTGALVRAMKGGERMACFTLGSGEHSISDTDPRSGYSAIKDLLERNNYKTDTLKLLEKAEIPSTCVVLVVGGPRHDYIPPVVAAIKNYVENGGSALIMMDPPLKFAREEIDDNQAFLDVLTSWGVTVDKDLVLDTSGVGQLFGLGPEYALVTGYESHAIVREMKEIPTGFPIARSLDVKAGGKTTVDKLFETSESSFGTMNLKSPEIKPGKDDKKGPLTLGAAGTYTSGKETNGRFVVVGSSNWVGNGFLKFNGNRDLFLNMMNWLTSDEDLISIRPKETEDRRLNMTTKQMNLVFYESIVAIPLLIVLAGVGVWWRRR